jgi:hypothetical protein
MRFGGGGEGPRLGCTKLQEAAVKEIFEMRHPFLTPRFGLLAAALLTAVLLLPSLASAQTREFTGRIDKVNKKQMIVDNRMGDKVKFVYVKKETTVEGTKSEWKKLKTKDWVTVSWKFIDKPRKAYKVVVFEKEDKDGEE